MQGVQPLNHQQQTGLKIMQNMLNQQKHTPKAKKNICYGTAKTSGEGTASSNTMLAADVSLVASGVGKGCTEDNLKEFLVGRGINPVEVEMLTKKEVMCCR